MPINIAIADDHPLAINGLKSMLRAYKDITIANTYASGAALLQGLADVQPDVLLLDVLLPDYTGDALAAMISEKYPSIRILAITSLDAPMQVRKMLRSGCSGYLLKTAEQHILAQAIREVYEGREFIEPVLQQQLFVQKKKSYEVKSRVLQVLTSREKEILQLIVEGLNNQEIAQKLFLSLRTVENHRHSIMQKMGVKDAINLMKAAIELGMSK